VAATTGRGIEAALAELDRHQAHIAPDLAGRRAEQGRLWLRRWLHEECGRRGAARAEALLPSILTDRGVSPFRWLHRAVQALEQG
jgi:hypothetical protein